jgi:hypothetical protein
MCQSQANKYFFGIGLKIENFADQLNLFFYCTYLNLCELWFQVNLKMCLITLIMALFGEPRQNPQNRKLLQK